jgi:hypothetical protein
MAAGKRVKGGARTKAAEDRVAAKLLKESGQAPPARPSLIISDEGEVCQVKSDDWREVLCVPLDNKFCKGCKVGPDCIITKIAAVAFCDRRETV